jgi:AraC-like DNA-binding protein
MSEHVGDVLGSIRVRGAVLSLALLEAPFTVSSGRIAHGVFHAVLSGRAWASTSEHDAAHLEPGQVALFPTGASHIISDAPEPTAPPVPVSASLDGNIPAMRVETGGPLTRILCGTIEFDRSPVFDPSSGLPQMIVTGQDKRSDWVRSTVLLIAEELAEGAPASAVVAERLADVLVLRALREVVSGTSGDAWIAGVRDPRLAAAVGAIHAEPGHPWTVAELAHLSAMSRSSFYDRFTSVVGLPPGEYVARWRVHTACMQLRTTDLAVSSIGRQVGFSTNAGFSTAFKRLVGVSPRQYRYAEAG